jgi:hypothetical protein
MSQERKSMYKYWLEYMGDEYASKLKEDSRKQYQALKRKHPEYIKMRNKLNSLKRSGTAEEISKLKDVMNENKQKHSPMITKDDYE